MAAPLLIAALAASALAWGRLPVARVVLEAPGAQDPAELRRTFGVEPGSTLSRSEIRLGVQALLASGQVEDAVVSVEEEPAGAAIQVHAQIAARVRSLKLDGLPRPEQRRVSRDLRVVVASTLKVGEFEDNLARAVAALRDQGYPEARLEPDLDFDVAGGTVAVHVQGDLGRPLTAAALEVEGAELAGAPLWKASDLRPGQRLSTGALARSQRRLGEYFRKQGYWDAEVDVPTVTDGEGGALVHLRVVLGHKYRLDLEGLKMTKSLAEDALPFLRGEEPFDEAALDLAVRRVRLFLQRQGHLRPAVTASLAADGDAEVLHIKVASGPVRAIRAVRFPGSHTLPEALLRERVGARTGHPWRWGGEPVDEETLAADVTSLLGTLREAGFADARVDAARVVLEGDELAIEFPIVEGERRLVSRVDVTGVPPGVALPHLPVSPDGPWSELAERRARELVEAALREAGYPDATVEVSHDCQADRCGVTLGATAGEPAVTGRIVVAGLARTRLKVVRKVAGLTEGQVVGPQAQLLAQRRLLGLGLFERVGVRTIPGQETGARRGLLIDVEEGPSRAVSLGLGWDNVENARVSLAWSELNLFGTARSLSVDMRVSSREQHFQIGYREPQWLGLLKVPTSVSIYRTEEHFADYDLFRRGVLVELGDRAHRPGRALLRYDYQIQRAIAPEAVLSEVERDKQNLAVASFTPVLEWDTRDDLFSPRRGVYANVQLQSAFRAFLADASFEKASGGVAGFHPLAGGVLALALRAGAIEPRERCHAPCPSDNLRLPVAVRFYGGGRVTHRAFATDRLGADGTFDESGRALGGGGQLFSSLEWRFPVVSVVGGSVFVDGGNVWPGWRDVRTSELRWGAGLGVRVETPVGPFRLEYGWKLDRKTGESAGQLFLAFGNPF